MDLAICFPDVAARDVSSSPMARDASRIIGGVEPLPGVALPRSSWLGAAEQGAAARGVAGQITEATVRLSPGEGERSAADKVAPASAFPGGMRAATTHPYVAWPGLAAPGEAHQCNSQRRGSTSPSVWNRFWIDGGVELLRHGAWQGPSMSGPAPRRGARLGPEPLRMVPPVLSAQRAATQFTEAMYLHRRESFAEASRRRWCRYGASRRPASLRIAGRRMARRGSANHRGGFVPPLARDASWFSGGRKPL
jgi:hypothetical protein